MSLLDKIKSVFGKKAEIRSGALSPEQVKEKIQSAGIGKVVEIIRIGYDGEIDDMPLIMQIIEIEDDYFIGKIVNPERDMIEDTSDTVIYAKKGGGTIEYYYNDGDIKDIIISNDEEILTSSKNLEELREILEAIEVDDPVLVCYWNKSSHGTVNALGVLKDKNLENGSFKVELTSINNIELEKKQEINLDLNKDLIIDIQYAG
ncbi:MAG: hypothetical protein Kow00108_17640 [Calditrichia bacterium]